MYMLSRHFRKLSYLAYFLCLVFNHLCFKSCPHHEHRFPCISVFHCPSSDLVHFLTIHDVIDLPCAQNMPQVKSIYPHFISSVTAYPSMFNLSFISFVHFGSYVWEWVSLFQLLILGLDSLILGLNVAGDTIHLCYLCLVNIIHLANILWLTWW